MPIYEYRCDDCDRVTSVFVRSVTSSVEAVCEHCGSKRLQRMMSRVARVKTAADVLDEYGDGSGPEGVRDPRQIGRWVEKRFEEYGVEVPAETRDAIARAREGDLPDAVKDV
ncbi:MAG: zinc ribbon domain-containing protein [Dehalococcoidia bacterium]